ncbi:hypothetical protein Leryth_017623 [Lithospermum erythrorhizon]|nr:hypothetical protein Leryth_017623 [Lithospermum erythrorhizon]
MNSCSEKNQETCKKFQLIDGVLQFSQVIIISLLSLLLPVAFLLLARITTAQYLISVAVFQQTEDFSVLASFFFSSHARWLQYGLVGVITCLAFVNILNGNLVQMWQSSDNVSIRRSCVYHVSCWIFLCAFQVLVCFGLEGSIYSGIDASGFGLESDWLRRVVVFLGLHETMRFCSKMVVKPVVDDTLFGHVREERWVEKAALAFSFGMFWWWRLRDEVEALVVLVEVKRMLEVGIGIGDFFGWSLYYLVVAIGVARVGKSLLWIGGVVWQSGVEVNKLNNSYICDIDETV